MKDKGKLSGWLLRGAIALLLFTAAGILVSRARAGGTLLEQPAEPLAASGVIQVTEVSIASEFGGLIGETLVQEAQNVTATQVLVQLDTTLLNAQIEVAQAWVDMAEAGLAQAKAGARPGQVAVAEAQLAQVEAGYLAAQRGVSDTQILVANPQEIDLQIAVTRAKLESARHQQARANTLKDATEYGKNQFDEIYAEFDGGGREKFLAFSGTLDDVLTNVPEEIRQYLPDISGLADGIYTYGEYEVHVENGTYTVYKWVNIVFPLEAQLLPNMWWQSWVGVNAATVQVEGLEATLAQLYKQRRDPQMLQTKADEAQGMLAQIEAQKSLASAQVNGLEAGLTAEQIAALEARVAQAYAGLNALQQQREMYALSAPLSGTVTHLIAYPGEVVAAGAPLLTIADFNDMSLTVYVPENHLGEVWLDQRVQITVNSYPGQIFEGQVERIADQAEFTPRNVATKEERVNLVFAVEIRVNNSEDALKPGMPADVVFVNDK